MCFYHVIQVWEFAAYFMRPEHKRTGRPIDHKYTLAVKMDSKVAGRLSSAQVGMRKW